MASVIGQRAAASEDGSSGEEQTGRRPIGVFFSRPEVGALIGALAVATLFMAVAPSFRDVGNLGTILYGSAAIGVMAVGVSLLMVGGEFDLSAGVAATFAGVVASLTAWNFGLNVWVGVLLALVAALAVGAFNGWLLLRTGLPSFLVTLGTFFVLRGVDLAVTRLVGGGVSTPRISDMAGFDSARAVFAWQVTLGAVTLKALVVYWVLLVAVGSFVLTRTRVGNWIYAVGGDAEAARAVGVPVAAVKIGLFMAVGLCAWVLGMHLLLEYSVVQSGEGVGNEFIYIIAAVVGGCLLTGGYGSVVGGALGALIYGMTYAGIGYAGWDVDWLYAFLGVMLLLATIVNLWVRRRAEGA